MPVIKTHRFAEYSCSLKNFVGAVHPRYRPSVTFWTGDWHERIAEINLAVHPALTVADGTTTMIEGGPTSGTLSKTDLVICSGDRVAVDLVAIALLRSFGTWRQVDLENSATTILLINKGSGSAPVTTLDLDSNDDGLLDLPAGWSVVDSVGILDSASAAATDYSYGAITFRAAYPAGNYLGTSAYGNIIDVPGAPPTTAGAFYVGRKYESTGSSVADWFAANLTGSASDPLNITFASATDPGAVGRKLPDMVFGGMNPIPEPGTLALLGLGALALLARRQTR